MSGQSRVATAQEPLILDPKAPLSIAREFLLRHYMQHGARTLHHYNGEFFLWTGTRYQPARADELRAQVYRFLDAARQMGSVNAFNPNRTKVDNVIDALRAECNLGSGVGPPAWLDTPVENVDAGEVISCANYLVHLPTGRLLEDTPTLFNLHAVEYPFDPNASPPLEFLRFLDSLWPVDEGERVLLQQLFGYLLTNNTYLQKAFLIVGPPRSGKGTIANVLRGLLGASNVISPSLNSLANNFGLAPLIGKRLAIVPDARLSGRVDKDTIVERVLSITGEDIQTIDRKFMEPWSGKLGVRFVIFSNDIPVFRDSSGAVLSRLIVLRLTKSFLGQEDHQLAGRLLSGLPGILNWAIEGWIDLAKRGCFTVPASSDQIVDELGDLSSPVHAFLRERCLISPTATVGVHELFGEWCDWCALNGQDPGTVQVFGRDVRAAVPQLKVVQQPRNSGRSRGYVGVGLQ